MLTGMFMLLMVKYLSMTNLVKSRDVFRLEERPISLAIGGRQKDMLFVTTSSSFYGIKIR